MSDRCVVVVGVDGSTQSGAALQWAGQYAGSMGGELRAVIAWEHAPGFGFFPGGRAALEREAALALERTIEKHLDRDDVVVTMRTVEGNPSSVLVEESVAADLLVVGDRGYGGFAGLMLGSVGENCVRHAKCSVVVVKTEPRSSSVSSEPSRGASDG